MCQETEEKRNKEKNEAEKMSDELEAGQWYPVIRFKGDEPEPRMFFGHGDFIFDIGSSTEQLIPYSGLYKIGKKLIFEWEEITDIRITKGIAIYPSNFGPYTRNFTPPTEVLDDE